MANLTRRDFVGGAAAVSLGATVFSRPVLQAQPATSKRRILCGTGTDDGILAFDWDPANGELAAAGVAAKLRHPIWLAPSPQGDLFVAQEIEEYQGKPTGAVASFSLIRAADGKPAPAPISAVPSAGTGCCHVAVDRTGSVLLAANYTGGSVASFRISAGKLSQAVYTETYRFAQGKVHGPVADRQEKPHAHFASFSPDNRFAYVNDLGSDCIHIYLLDSATAMLTPAGRFEAHPGAGPRTLHFHPRLPIAYCVNELSSSVTVLAWAGKDGSLRPAQQVELLPADFHGKSTGCDAVLSRDGRFAYFCNRFNNFLMSFAIDPATGLLTAMERTPCGGDIPRQFTLDPSERWALVANQGSNRVSVFARDRKTGRLSNEGKSYPAQVPMCLVFV